jgi:preprotein translocase subunit YajC
LLVWFLLVLPQKRRNRMHAAMQDGLVAGDEIITAGGLHAIVRDLDEDELQIEIAPNVLATLDRRAVAAVARHEPEPGAPVEAS